MANGIGNKSRAWVLDKNRLSYEALTVLTLLVTENDPRDIVRMVGLVLMMLRKISRRQFVDDFKRAVTYCTRFFSFPTLCFQSPIFHFNTPAEVNPPIAYHVNSEEIPAFAGIKGCRND
jgi:hypothetical protein